MVDQGLSSVRLARTVWQRGTCSEFDPILAGQLNSEEKVVIEPEGCIMSCDGIDEDKDGPFASGLGMTL
jgi:hypothetical protein